jgi:hypothetical protein
MDEMGRDEKEAIERDDRNGVRIQDNVRFSFTQVERSGYVYNVVSRIRRPSGEVPYF